MNSKFYKMIIWSVLVSLVLIAIPSIIRHGPETFQTTFVASDDFQHEMNQFYRSVSQSVLNPLSFEDAKERITVSAEEIDRHRTWYGTLAEQIESIREQYIFEDESEDEAVKDILTKERDEKIADIIKNFEDDAHVEKKVRAEKIEMLQAFIANHSAKEASDFPVAYEFKDLETGEVFKQGDVQAAPYYKKTFTEGHPFIAHSLDKDYIEDEISSDLYQIPMYQVINAPKKFTGTVIVSKQDFNNSYLSRIAKNYTVQKYGNIAIWTLSLIALVLLLTVFKFQKTWLQNNQLINRYETVSIDVKILIFLLTLVFTVEVFLPRTMHLFFNDNFYSYRLYGWAESITALAFLAAGVCVITTQLVLFIERWKKKGIFEQDLKNSYASKFLKAVREMFLNRSLGVQMFILLIGFFLAGIGFILVAVEPYLILAYVPAVMFLGLPALYIFVRRAAYMNKIFKATEDMAAGRLHQEIKIVGRSPFAQHAKNLNNLREGVRISMNEQAKSERLKTELITNVSHDLRTPLTSIITYTDLLKSDHLTEDERKKYVDVLDKKSARLKVLIDDLFEVSKMASGNIELYREEVDLTQLVQQTLAEHEDEMAATDLEFRIQLPDTPMIAYVDGQKWWRVLDNLIVNALKYAMPHTRVYLTLEAVGNQAQFVIKNVSKYELNNHGEELFERFKRADTSRHTEGSGLGLAIAQSIVNMHEGTMRIDVDGDLFKVTVDVPLRYR